MKVKFLIVLLTLVLCVFVRGDNNVNLKRIDFEPEHYEQLFNQIVKEYERRQNDYNELYKYKTYHYEVLEAKDFPTYCSDQFPVNWGGTLRWIESQGFVLVIRDNGAYICVRSWIERQGEKNIARVARIFRFEMTQNGWQIAEVTKILQTWHSTYGWICKEKSNTRKRR